jgi:hypothetical protein
MLRFFVPDLRPMALPQRTKCSHCDEREQLDAMSRLFQLAGSYIQ